MGKNLSQMTWNEVEQQMSIAGSPTKITQLGREIEALLLPAIDATNRAELTNVDLMLRRLMAEIKLAKRMYDKSHWSHKALILIYERFAFAHTTYIYIHYICVYEKYKTQHIQDCRETPITRIAC